MTKGSRVCLILALSLAIPATAPALKAGDHTFPEQVRKGGANLKLVGAGERTFLFMDIYSMGLYSESGSCCPRHIIKRDEVKMIRFLMSRDLPAGRLSSTIEESLMDSMPCNAAADLKERILTFAGLLKKDCPENSSLEILYVPGKGTSLRQNKTVLGTVPGKDLADLIFASYFGKKTCCEDLKESIIETCAARQN